MDQYQTHIEWIDKERPALIKRLLSWVNIHSGSANLPGLEAMIKELKTAFSVLEGQILELPLPPRKVLGTNGAFQDVRLGKVLSIQRHPEAKCQILLAGHMDIALSNEISLEKPQRSSRDILNARGAADMKSGLLIMLTALRALEKSPFCGKIGWTVLINCDEEIGSPCSSEILRREAKRHAIGLVFEPSHPDGSLVSFRKGSVNYYIAIKGRGAHAGREFLKGKNAVASAARFALAAESLSDLAGDITVNVGSLQGGGPLNTVPENALLGLNIRAKNSKDFPTIHQKLKKIAAVETAREGVAVSIYKDTERLPKIFDKTTRTLFESLKTCAESLGIRIEWKSAGGVCDGNILANEGLPTIDTLGGVGGCLHTSKEYVSIVSIVQRAKLIARFLMQIASGEVAVPRSSPQKTKD